MSRDSLKKALAFLVDKVVDFCFGLLIAWISHFW